MTLLHACLPGYVFTETPESSLRAAVKHINALRPKFVVVTGGFTAHAPGHAAYEVCRACFVENW